MLLWKSSFILQGLDFYSLYFWHILFHNHLLFVLIQMNFLFSTKCQQKCSLTLWLTLFLSWSVSTRPFSDSKSVTSRLCSHSFRLLLNLWAKSFRKVPSYLWCVVNFHRNTSAFNLNFCWRIFFTYEQSSKIYFLLLIK